MTVATRNQAELTQALSEMPALFLPDPVSWWPPAPGWWILSALSIALIVWAGIGFARRYREQSVIRQALRELNELVDSIGQQTQQSEHLGSLIKASAILRQVTNDHLEQRFYSTESGEQWLKSLDSMVNTESSRPKQTIMNSPEGKVFEKIYTNEDISSQEISAALTASKKWIKAAARSKQRKTENQARQARPRVQASSIMLDRKGEY